MCANHQLARRSDTLSRAARTNSSRPLVAAVLAVVLSFLMTLVFSYLRIEGMGEELVEIEENAAPSLERLSVAQTELVRISAATSLYTSNPTPSTAQQARAALAKLAENVAPEAQAPFLPGEADVFARITNEVGTLGEAMDGMFEAGERGNASAARTSAREVRAAIEPLSRSIDVATQMNLASTREGARVVAGAHSHAKLSALFLGGASLLTAVSVTLLARRVLTHEERASHEDLRLANARANELELFAARIAHDLKTPLASLGLRIQAIQRAGPDGSRLHDACDKAELQIYRMDRTIDGLFDFARAGAEPLPDETADVSEVVLGTVSDARPSAEAIGADLSVDVSAPCIVACSPGALTSVLSNLVGNAVKYITEGEGSSRSIRVRVCDQGDAVHFEVTDTGPGLPSGAADIVFEPFVRLPGMKSSGLGLGLATVKRIVLAHGGRVGARPEPPHGATFWFELPKPGRHLPRAAA
jgi:signal transduction histidine kinase